MPIYISRGRFTSDAVKGMVAKPENREEAVSKLFESVGGKLIGWYLTFGRHDWLVIGEFPDDKACASAILAAAAGGSLSDIETTLALGAGLVDSCAGCHGRPRGAAGSGGSVFTRPESRDAPHLFGAGLKGMLADEITAELRALRAQAIDIARQQGEAVNRPLTSKGIHYFKPGTYRQTQAKRDSRRMMEAIGCT